MDISTRYNAASFGCVTLVGTRTACGTLSYTHVQADTTSG